MLLGIGTLEISIYERFISMICEILHSTLNDLAIEPVDEKQRPCPHARHFLWRKGEIDSVKKVLTNHREL